MQHHDLWGKRKQRYINGVPLTRCNIYCCIFLCNNQGLHSLATFHLCKLVNFMLWQVSCGIIYLFSNHLLQQDWIGGSPSSHDWSSAQPLLQPAAMMDICTCSRYMSLTLMGPNGQETQGQFILKQNVVKHLKSDWENRICPNKYHWTISNTMDSAPGTPTSTFSSECPFENTSTGE